MKKFFTFIISVLTLAVFFAGCNRPPLDLASEPHTLGIFETVNSAFESQSAEISETTSAAAQVLYEPEDWGAKTTNLGVYTAGYDFHASFAKTPKYLYYVAVETPEGAEAYDYGAKNYILTRARWDNLGKTEEIPCPDPKEYQGRKITGSSRGARFSGITSEWLFISLSVEFEDDEYDSNAGYNTKLVYMISHDGTEQIFLGECHYEGALMNPENFCLYFLKDATNEMTEADKNAEDEYGYYIRERKVLLEAYNLKSGKNEVIYGKDGSLHRDGYTWERTKEGKAVLSIGRSDSGSWNCPLLIIYGDNKIDNYGYGDFYAKNEIESQFRQLKKSPETEAAKKLAVEYDVERRNIRDYEVDIGDFEIYVYDLCGEWLYYVTNGLDTEIKENQTNYNCLYRIKPDGSGHELLRSGTHIGELITVGNKLFVFAFYDDDREMEGFESRKAELHEMDERGKALSTLHVGYTGHNHGIGIGRYEGRIIVYDGNVYGGNNFIGLYDPATGKSINTGVHF